MGIYITEGRDRQFIFKMLYKFELCEYVRQLLNDYVIYYLLIANLNSKKGKTDIKL